MTPNNKFWSKTSDTKSNNQLKKNNSPRGVAQPLLCPIAFFILQELVREILHIAQKLWLQHRRWKRVCRQDLQECHWNAERWKNTITRTENKPRGRLSLVRWCKIWYIFRICNPHSYWKWKYYPFLRTHLNSPYYKNSFSRARSISGTSTRRCITIF